MTRTQRLLVLGGLAVSAIFLVIAFNGLNPAAVWGYIQRADAPLLLLALVWYFSAVVVISMRWGYLLRSVQALPLRALFSLVCICYMGNNVYPMRAGEALRLALLVRQHRIPLMRGATVSIVERVFDGLVMVSFIVVALAVLDVTSPEVRTIASLTAPAFVAGLLVFFTLAARPNWLRALVSRISRLLPEKLRAPLLHLTEDVIAGLQGLRTPADLAGAVLLSYASWMLEASVYWLVAFAFGLDLGYPAMLLTVGVVNLSGLIPAAPGQFGVYEAFVILVLTALGIGRDLATAYAFTIHMVIWLPVTVVGFVLLLRMGLGVNVIAQARQIEAEAEKMESEAAPL